MWRLWSGPLEFLGRLRFPRLLPRFLFRRKIRVGDPAAPDGRGGYEWREFLRAQALFDAWGPHPDGPWVPYHTVPLFAALDRLDARTVGPASPLGTPGRSALSEELPASAQPGAPAPSWVVAGTWVILDLPGPRSVEAAAWLVDSAGCQPVCTFDNWPHEKGVLKPENTLAELLRWAAVVASARARLVPGSPPVWLCDRERLGERPGRPGEFDNRYFLDDSVLPTPARLLANGIDRVIYVVQESAHVPVEDLEVYFSELLGAGIPVLRTVLTDPTGEPRPLSSPPSPRKPPRSGFRRSAAGGFGTIVPEPSSGGGGGS